MSEAEQGEAQLLLQLLRNGVVWEASRYVVVDGSINKDGGDGRD